MTFSHLSSRAKPLISVVSACFNEEANVAKLYERVRDVLDADGQPFELIFVDDGSFDGTFTELRQLSLRDPRVRVVRLTRNFGHQAALTAGLQQACGEAVVTMDADLQHPPEIIPELVRAWRECGVDIVYAIRDASSGAGLFKSLTSRLFYALIRRVSDVDLPTNAADFRLMSRAVVDVINRIPERSRLLRGLVHWTGFPFTTISYCEEPRYAGTTKYSLRRMATLSVDSVTAFSTLPLRLSTMLGLITACGAAIYAIGAIIVRLFVPQLAVEGWASVLVSVLFLGGAQLLALGLLGEYVGRIFEETKQRPLYITREQLGFDTRDITNGSRTVESNVNAQGRRVTRRASLHPARPEIN
jgi:polyisoprenyl-phosphate glycosyltransferase